MFMTAEIHDYCMAHFGHEHMADDSKSSSAWLLSSSRKTSAERLCFSINPNCPSRRETHGGVSVLFHPWNNANKHKKVQKLTSTFHRRKILLTFMADFYLGTIQSKSAFNYGECLMTETTEHQKYCVNICIKKQCQSNHGANQVS